MRTICILKGIPGSGKSTYARELLKKEQNRWKRVNRDDLRSMIDNGVYSHDNEGFVKDVQDSIIRRAFREGYDVILDNTNLVGATVRRVHQLVESIGDVMVIEKYFDVPVEECLRRNALRVGSARVPDNVITDMAKKAGAMARSSTTYYPPRGCLVAEECDVSLPNAIICDIDGTLAIINDRNPYDPSLCWKDIPNKPVIECIKAMHAHGCTIIFMTGRQEKWREQTETYITDHVRVPIIGFDVAGSPTRPIQHELIMRATGDMRKDSVVKQELFDAHVKGKFNVLFAIDDRDQVVQQWRFMGLTCFQCAEGDF